MEKYKHQEDEHKLQKLIGKLVLEGRPVFVDENGLTPPELGEFDMKEVAICVSDMITDEYLQVSGEKEGAVNAISASHGYRWPNTGSGRTMGWGVTKNARKARI